MTPVLPSSRACVKASSSSRTVSGRNEFRTFGRLIVIFAIASFSSCSYKMSEYSRTGIHLTDILVLSNLSHGISTDSKILKPVWQKLPAFRGEQYALHPLRFQHAHAAPVFASCVQYLHI